jgi:AcrR family transcriptional regulator
MDASETRVRILRAALSEFSARGFRATSIQAIATRVGISKAAVLYHFESKDEILAALTAPMLDGMESALVAAELSDPGQAGWTVLTGLLEVWLSHRYLMRMSLHDLALVGGSAFERYRDAGLRANALVAGANPDLATRIRASQALAMLGDPVVLFADEPTDALRERVLEGVRRLLGQTEVVNLPRRRRGRKSVLSEAIQKKVLRLYRLGEAPAQIAIKTGVSRATIYRFIKTNERRL